MAALFTTYISPDQFRRSPTGLESSTLVSNISTLSAPISTGSTSLPLVLANTTQYYVNDRVTIFDKASSEVVTVTTSTPPGSQTIPITPTLASHSAGVVVCGDGQLGSLADQIVIASKWLENICKQDLWISTYTGETMRMPSMRASIDNQQMLIFRPRHFPVLGDSGITIQMNNVNPISYDSTQLILDGEAEVVSVPWVTVQTGIGGGGSTYSILSHITRSTNLWLKITYSAGFDPMPPDVREAMICLTAELLSKRQNPTMATNFSLESKHITRVSTRDLKGQGSLVSRAEYLLDFYKVRSF